MVWNAREILCAAESGAEYLRGLNPASPGRALPLSKGQIESLRQALRSVPDPRKSNRCWPLSVLLCLVCMGLLAGGKNLAEIHRYGQFLTQTQRAWLGFLPKGRGLKGRRAPSYQALYKLLTKLDADTLAGCLNGWLQSHWGSLPRGLALDGTKFESTNRLQAAKHRSTFFWQRPIEKSAARAGLTMSQGQPIG